MLFHLTVSEELLALAFVLDPLAVGESLFEDAFHSVEGCRSEGLC